MVIWMIRHWKLCLGVFVTMVTTFALPGFMSIFAFFLRAEQTMANVKVHDEKIMELERIAYSTDGKMSLLLEMTAQSIKTNKEVKKEVRQLRLSK